jgi:gentisate 1,2-dioxygenase
MAIQNITDEEKEARRELLNEKMGGLHLGGLWQTRKRLEALQSHIWAWKDIWACLGEAGEVVAVDERAPMRTIQLINPTLEEVKATSRTIQVSVQLLQNGEQANAHRHTQPQPRFIVEADGAYTTVEGEQIFMHTRDFIVTPGWGWHDHTNPSQNPAIWLDVHNPHLLGYLGAMFNERFGEKSVQPITHEEGYHLKRAGMYRAKAFTGGPSDVPMKYTWADTLNALGELESAGESDPYEGVILEYRSPVDGGPAMPTIGAHVQVLRPGEETKMHRHTDTTIYHVVEGSGATSLGAQDEKTIEWDERDCFILPPWEWHKHSNTSNKPAYLFSVTDAPAIDLLGFHQEERKP